MSLENLTPEQRQALALGALTRQLVSNPETAEATQRLLMKADPKLRFPELEVRDSVSKLREDMNDRLKEQQEENRQLKAQLQQEKLHAMVTNAGLNVEDVQKLMLKHGLTSNEENYRLAMQVLQQDATVAEPSSGSDFTPLEAPNVKEMWADPVKWRGKEMEKIVKEMRGKRFA